MFGHFPELVVVLVLALIFFGPEKLPEIAGSAGKMIGELRSAMDAVTHQDEEIEDDEFSTYYYESLQRQGNEEELEELPDPADEGDYPRSDTEWPDVDSEDAGEKNGSHPVMPADDPGRREFPEAG